MIQLPERPTEDELMTVLRSILNQNPQLFTNREDDHGCFMRALRRGEPTFTLVAQDETAARTVRRWLDMNQQLSQDRQRQVVERAEAMDAWPTKKRAD